jgi:N-methylhydantoinase A
VFSVGVDSGGTFTDSVIIGDDGSVTVGKALSTPARPAQGVLDSIGQAAQHRGLSLREALQQARFLAHGTTVGVNALLTATGERVGMLMTSGFEDTLAIARTNKALGLSEDELTRATAWEKPAPIVEPGMTRGLLERVDRDGSISMPLDEEHARMQVQHLKDAGIRSVGVCLLWSFLNPAHEQRVAEILREMIPDAHVTLSSVLAPRMGEYERANTVALNCYVGHRVTSYLTDLEQTLEAHGLGGPLLVAQSAGGVQYASAMAARPIDTLMSGPVGGVGASIAVGRHLGHHDIITTDVGGTSFDVSIVLGGEPQYARRPMVGRDPISNSVVDIESIGTGGGSIAWVDERTNALHVGPQSAAADPGPACYGRGGVLPTVTDAAAALGYLTSVGPQLSFSREAAVAAIEEHIAAPLRIDVLAAAEAVLQVACAQMADLVRRMTVQRGQDPRDATLYAFGGAAPQYAGRYADDLGVREVVFPVNAPVFSAFGAVCHELRSVASSDSPRHFPPDIDWLLASLAELEERASARLASDFGEISTTRRMRMRFRRQTHELFVPLPAGRIDVDALEAAEKTFVEEYERLFGEGTAYRDAGVDVIGLVVEATVPLGLPSNRRDHSSTEREVRTRSAWFAGRELSCEVVDSTFVDPRQWIAGPAFVEMPTTTIVVNPGQRLRVDERGNAVLQMTGATSGN